MTPTGMNLLGLVKHLVGGACVTTAAMLCSTGDREATPLVPPALAGVASPVEGQAPHSLGFPADPSDLHIPAR